jgi:hypothetical protein
MVKFSLIFLVLASAHAKELFAVQATEKQVILLYKLDWYF